MKNVLKILMILPFLIMATGVAAQGPEEEKVLSGISIVGNKEAPKSLFIVPWKSSEIGVETDLSSQLLNEKLKAVDKDVFERELGFYHTMND